MKTPAHILLLGAMATAPANSQSIIDDLCGPGHVSETAVTGSVTENPDGYFIAGLQTQLSHGDPRIVTAIGSAFHLCTRPASNPGMDQTQIHAAGNRRVVTYLFVPVISGAPDPNS